jgi:hypothetical protein
MSQRSTALRIPSSSSSSSFSSSGGTPPPQPGPSMDAHCGQPRIGETEEQGVRHATLPFEPTGPSGSKTGYTG